VSDEEFYTDIFKEDLKRRLLQRSPQDKNKIIIEIQNLRYIPSKFLEFTDLIIDYSFHHNSNEYKTVLKSMNGICDDTIRLSWLIGSLEPYLQNKRVWAVISKNSQMQYFEMPHELLPPSLTQGPPKQNKESEFQTQAMELLKQACVLLSTLTSNNQ
jgi:hypothetical protein